MVMFACMLGGCGKKAEPDKNSTQVMKLSITPEPTPTPEPETINKDAVVTNGNMTMVNEYLMSKPKSGK